MVGRVKEGVLGRDVLMMGIYGEGLVGRDGIRWVFVG